MLLTLHSFIAKELTELRINLILQFTHTDTVCNKKQYFQTLEPCDLPTGKSGVPYLNVGK
jgi:hypothetical protein